MQCMRRLKTQNLHNTNHWVFAKYTHNGRVKNNSTCMSTRAREITRKIIKWYECGYGHSRIHPYIFLGEKNLLQTHT